MQDIPILQQVFPLHSAPEVLRSERGQRWAAVQQDTVALKTGQLHNVGEQLSVEGMRKLLSTGDLPEAVQRALACKEVVCTARVGHSSSAVEAALRSVQAKRTLEVRPLDARHRLPCVPYVHHSKCLGCNY